MAEQHLTEQGEFKSDKYPWCPEGFFALKFSDEDARKVISLYAALTDNKELAADLLSAVRTVENRSVEPEPIFLNPLPYSLVRLLRGARDDIDWVVLEHGSLEWASPLLQSASALLLGVLTHHEGADHA